MTKSEKHNVLTVSAFNSGMEADPILSFSGIAQTSKDGTSVVGDGRDGTIWRFETTENFLRGTGRPSNTATKNMTIVLKNILDQYQLGKYSRNRAEELAGRPVRNLQRANKARLAGGGQIRQRGIYRLNDGRLLAVLWMHDDHNRGNELSGPAWVMTSGEKFAKFISDARAPE